mgnify:CR=1 FL=1
MLLSQRHLFDIPSDIIYLNTAFMSPLLNSVVKAIDKGTQAKAHPWKIKTSNFFVEAERARSLFSKIQGDENTIMGLPINKIKEYLKNYE